MKISSYILLLLLIASVSSLRYAKKHKKQGNLSFLQKDQDEAKLTNFVSSGNCNEVCVSWPDILSDTAKNVLVRAKPVEGGQPEVDFNNPCQPNVRRVLRLLDEDDFNYLFAKKNDAYTFTDFVTAIAKFPYICNDKGPGQPDITYDEMCAIELAGMFAHFTQETGGHSPYWETSEGIEEWRQGLYFLEEVCGTEGSCTYNSNCGSGWTSDAWPCGDGKAYYGRGAKQLTWNYNYGPFSRVMFDDVTILLNNPERVAEEGWLALAGAIWFYQTPQTPKPSMHDVIVGQWEPNSADEAAKIFPGLGASINVLNGGIECRAGATDSLQVQNRIKYFKEFMNWFDIDIKHGGQLSCGEMSAYPAGGSGYLDTYWDQSWSDKKCKLVNWQTGWSVLYPEDYDACGEAKYPGEYEPEGTTTPVCSSPAGDPNDSFSSSSSTVSETVEETPSTVVETVEETPSTPVVEEEIDC